MGLQIPPKNFSTSMSVEEILFQMDRSDGNTEKIHAGPCFLNYKLHQELLAQQQSGQEQILKEQRDFQTKYLDHSESLVKGTWVLALATMALVIATVYLAIRTHT